MSLHLVRFDPDARAAAIWFHAENLASRDGQRDHQDAGYAWHALLTAVFGRERAPRPFRVLARRGRPPQLLAYSAHDGASLRAHAAEFACPRALAALGADRLAAKPMPVFAAGRRLAFSLRVRPTVRRDRDGDRRQTAELDAAVAALGPRPHDPADRAAVYLGWIRRQLEAAGAAVESLRLDGVIGDLAPRRGRPDPAGVRRLVNVPGHSVTAAGGLRVVDAGPFAAALARGIGRHRAFGYGMLLLSPPEA
jgi:CRISPR system Cascade subunit CasE